MDVTSCFHGLALSRPTKKIYSQGYILGDIVLSIYDGDFLEEDLQKIANEPTTALDVDLMYAFLDELSSSEDAKWKLLKWSESNDQSPYFNCKAISCFHDDGFNLYRIRPLRSRLNKYRIIYAYDAEFDQIHLLAIVIAVKESFSPPPEDIHYDYSKIHEISKRIRCEYESIGIPKL